MWSADRPTDAHIVQIDSTPAPYRPGALFRRELPCIVRVLAEIRAPLDVVIVDGYVALDPEGTPGLGARLYETLHGAVPIVGVAAGIDPNLAAAHVCALHGRHRIPTVLRLVDRLARETR